MLSLFIQTAYAMGQSQTAQAGQPAGASSMLLQLAPMVLIFVVFYFLMILPQQKKQKKHQELLNNLKKGDKVVTSAGILGTVSAVKENNIISLEIASGVKIEVLKSSIITLETNKEQVIETK